MYLQGTATVPLGTPALARWIAPASVPPTGTFFFLRATAYSRKSSISLTQSLRDYFFNGFHHLFFLDIMEKC
jgi:hypothetical protein